MDDVTAENEKFEVDSSYDMKWDIERNGQKIQIDVGVTVDDNGEAYLDSASWGGEEFILSLEEEYDIIEHVEYYTDKPDDEKEIDDD